MGDKEVSLELTTDRKRRKAVPGLEAQVDIMTLDKSNFSNTDMQNSPTSTTEETFLLAGLAGEACPSQ